MTALHEAIDKLDALRRIPGTWTELRLITNSRTPDGETAWSLYSKYGPDGRDARYVSTDLLEVVTYLETHLGHQGLTAPVEQTTPPPQRKLKLKRSTPS